MKGWILPATSNQRVGKIILWLAALLPAGYLVRGAFVDELGANPIEKITDTTGRWTIVLLLATLAITPMRRWTGVNELIQYRRPLGLFAFFYAILHFLTYLVLDQFFDWGAIAEDIVERPFITIGFTALVLLIPLAVTSTKGMIRRLGRRWQAIHRLVYICGALAVLHFLWAVKLDTTAPVWFALLLIGLLAARLPAARRQAERARAQRRTSTSPRSSVDGPKVGAPSGPASTEKVPSSR